PISTFNVFVQFKISNKKLTPIVTAKNTKAYDHDQVILAAPVQPKSSAGKLIPVFFARASDAGLTAFDMKAITIDIPENAIPRVIADIKAFFSFIPASKPNTRIINGTKMADPKPKI